MNTVSSVSTKGDAPHITKEQPVDAQGLNVGVGFLPIDIGRIIFTEAKTNLDSMALVCKNWVALADEDKFLKILRDITPEISGVKEWKERIKVIKICDEIRIPREAYRIIAEGALLTFMPQEVSVLNENKEEEVVSLNSLEAIGRLFKNPITDLEKGYATNSWFDAIREERPLQKPHWVCLKTKVIGKSMDFEQQLKLVEEEDKKAYGDNSAMDPAKKKSLASENFGKEARKKPRQIIHISEPIDTMASALMAYAKSGNKIRHYVWDFKNKIFDSVRVGKKTDTFRLWVAFASSGFYVESYYGDGCDSAVGRVGFVCARKSFGLGNNGFGKCIIQ